MSDHTVPALAAAKESRSCWSCPNFAVGKLDNNGKPVTGKCAVFTSRVIGSDKFTEDENEAQSKMIARTCQGYGNANLQIGSGDPEFGTPVALPLVMVNGDEISSFKQNGLGNCQGCEHFVSAAALTNASWGAAGAIADGRNFMCAARGTTLNDTSVARGCELRSHGTFDDTLLGGLRVFPEYSKASIARFRAEVMRVGDRPSILPIDFDPVTYAGAPVSAQHAAMGIRAWVPLSDPNGTGNIVQLPTFRRDFFSPERAALIPNTGDEEHPELYVDYLGVAYDVAVAWGELDETPAAWGPPGVGKTELARYMAWIMQLPLDRISITGTSELDDLEGKMMFLDGETRYQPGRVVRGWTQPGVMLIDEPNVGPREVWQFLRPLTDNSKQLVVDADSGKPLARDPFCYLMFAMNPAWDIRNDGTNDLADADIRRLFHIEMALPPRHIEKQIIRSRCALDGFDIPETLLDMVMDISVGIRQSSANHDLPITWGVGTQIKVARYLNWFDPVRAYRLAAADSLDPEVRDLVLNEVRTHFVAQKV